MAGSALWSCKAQVSSFSLSLSLFLTLPFPSVRSCASARFLLSSSATPLHTLSVTLLPLDSFCQPYVDNDTGICPGAAAWMFFSVSLLLPLGPLAAAVMYPKSAVVGLSLCGGVAALLGQVRCSLSFVPTLARSLSRIVGLRRSGGIRSCGGRCWLPRSLAHSQNQFLFLTWC